MTLRQELQSLVARELELNGVHLDETAWLASDQVLDEISRVLAPDYPDYHEGRIPSFGVIFTETADALRPFRRLPLGTGQLGLLRRLADGVHSFLLYEKAQIAGLLLFAEARATELQLVRMIEASCGMVVQRSPCGTTKFFRRQGIITHLNRSWFSKPPVSEAVRRVAHCVPGVDLHVLNHLLEFAFHVLSPAAQTGATLVWHLAPLIRKTPQPPSLYEMSPLGLSLLEERDFETLCHLLSQVDGATVIDYDGKVVRTGVQLKHSQRAASLIPEYKGTRHTSGQRFSYDNGNTLVITVSEDGPVTIFSDGAYLTDLRSHSAEQEAKVLRSIAPEKKEGISSRSFGVLCKNCDKASLVEEVCVRDVRKPQSVSCSVCSRPLFSSNCFTLRCSPLKRLEDQGLRGGEFFHEKRGTSG